jgi:phosphoglycolate phosphatase-like HAD superfamily hydrolase
MATLVFDFGGLLCDSLNESMLVTWNSWHRRGIEAFCAHELARIPPAFRRDFLRCRAYSRHLGHFIMSFDDALPSIASQAEFDERYRCWGVGAVERFIAAVNTYREEVRHTAPSRWLVEQHLYPGIRDTLSTLDSSFYVATAKDAKSVAAIMDFHGVLVTPRSHFRRLPQQNNGVESGHDT